MPVGGPHPEIWGFYTSAGTTNGMVHYLKDKGPINPQGDVAIWSYIGGDGGKVRSWVIGSKKDIGTNKFKAYLSRNGQHCPYIYDPWGQSWRYNAGAGNTVDVALNLTKVNC